MKRSYKTIQREVNPDTILFLGDMFDGGREWSTIHPGFTASEEQWKKYGHNYWLNEYDRFGRIFFAPDQISGGLQNGKVKKVIATLPGNHDLGFGKGVQPVVRRRFHAYFGEGDRVDIVGNHTFVGLDTVSLSAMDIPEAPPEIWNTTMKFLDNVQDYKQRAIEHELVHMHDLESSRKFSHETTEPQVRNRQMSAKGQSQYNLPTVVLSHVPLFRQPGTPCGPLREKYPPSAPNLDNDERNAIRVAAGFQYQNVLSPEVTKVIAEKVGNVSYAFSGDDHDYCEVTHRAYASAGGGIKETTVKSMSWAMGVRHPGIVLASLWNPIDGEGHYLPDSPEARGDATIQTHLCLLPDQLGIFIQYAVYLVLTLVAIGLHSIVVALRQKESASSASSVLPTTEPKKDLYSDFKARSRSSSNSTHSGGNGMLAPRSQTARVRSISPAVVLMGYGLPASSEKQFVPLINQAGFFPKEETDDWGHDIETKPMVRKKTSFARTISDQAGQDMLFVACPSLLWYYWLMTTG